ncbi:MAG: type II 3-dehydroquinate dehydratase [Chlorobi bacterium]|nr:type II 3-dehydroquinate dehydratase [Chlorobiota bacterium]
MNILIINGPNLNLLGIREKNIYGNTDFDTYLDRLKTEFSNIDISYFQSNNEGELITAIQNYGFGKTDGIILNAGAYTHTSLAIADAISAISTPVIEVHISNIFKREQVRHHSFIAPVCIGSVSGFGLDSYRLAIEALKRLNAQE